MGSICDMEDIARYSRSPEGKAHLEDIEMVLKDRRIVNVEFSNNVDHIETILILDNGEQFSFRMHDLEVDSIREEWPGVLDREYYVDYPERVPEEVEP